MLDRIGTVTYKLYSGQHTRQSFCYDCFNQNNLLWFTWQFTYAHVYTLVTI